MDGKQRAIYDKLGMQGVKAAWQLTPVLLDSVPLAHLLDILEETMGRENQTYSWESRADYQVALDGSILGQPENYDKLVAMDELLPEIRSMQFRQTLFCPRALTITPTQVFDLTVMGGLAKQYALGGASLVVALGTTIAPSSKLFTIPGRFDVQWGVLSPSRFIRLQWKQAFRPSQDSPPLELGIASRYNLETGALPELNELWLTQTRPLSPESFLTYRIALKMAHKMLIPSLSLTFNIKLNSSQSNIKEDQEVDEKTALMTSTSIALEEGCLKLSTEYPLAKHRAVGLKLKVPLDTLLPNNEEGEDGTFEVANRGGPAPSVTILYSFPQNIENCRMPKQHSVALKVDGDSGVTLKWKLVTPKWQLSIPLWLGSPIGHGNLLMGILLPSLALFAYENLFKKLQNRQTSTKVFNQLEADRRQAEALAIQSILRTGHPSRQSSSSIIIIRAQWACKKASVDVTIPLQYLIAMQSKNLQKMVDTFIIESSIDKNGLIGFWDPDPLCEKHLAIEYTYKGQDHIACFDQWQAVVLPQRQHRVINKTTD